LRFIEAPRKNNLYFELEDRKIAAMIHWACNQRKTFMTRWLSTMAVPALLLFVVTSARAQQELTLIAPNIIDDPIKELAKAFEAKTGIKVNPTIGAVVASKDRVVHGEPFDVPLVEVPYDAEAIKSGNVVSNSATALCNIALGVAVKKGAPKPDISTPDAVKRAFLAAQSIAHVNPNPTGAASGIAATEAIEKLGIAEQIKSKIMMGNGGARTMAMVANGQAEIGMTLLPGMQDPGIDIVGPLPREIAPPIVVVEFVSTYAKDSAAAKQLLTFLSSPEAAAVYKKYKMQPGR
jgi:molybdate transport system substrate-binding protein